MYCIIIYCYYRRPSHSSSAGPSRKRSRSPTTLVPLSSPVLEALSFVRVDLLPLHKRIRSSDSAIDLEDCSDESSKSSVPRDTSLRDDAEIDKCIAYTDALRAGGIVVRVVVETAAREEVETSARGMVEVRVNKVTHPVKSAVQSKRISELERDNTRLRGMLDVARLMPNTRSGATMTREAVDNLIGRRVAEALEARDAARNLKPLAEGRDEQGGKDGDDYEDGNRGVNANGNDNRDKMERRR
ncbi:hypothetical protein Tco_1252224 [Tanacetum coccineum]